ncbi:Spy/CpxP family protein refolding chaperone [Ideonella sp. BN130291]|uniref:Spy/CpxP family protein refolding chaperone n=1 Tax=Ideonella sp. BN130291 TaxID=3112940 RepID=UPI002E26AD02|nr:Spy/CpxP family protein refolding chaperone [Ideonella sp. BN130291]
MKAASFQSPVAFQSMRLLLAALILAVIGTFALTAYAQDGPRHGGHGGGHGMFMGPGVMGPHLDRMLDSVKATDAQRSQIKQIAQAAANDLKAQRESGKALHEQGMALFTQPTVDANAAEALRQQMMARHDQASKRMLQAMLDISRVLTPAQRQQLAQQMKQRHEMMQRHKQEREQLNSK